MYRPCLRRQLHRFLLILLGRKRQNLSAGNHTPQPGSRRDGVIKIMRGSRRNRSVPQGCAGREQSVLLHDQAAIHFAQGMYRFGSAYSLTLQPDDQLVEGGVCPVIEVTRFWPGRLIAFQDERSPALGVPASEERCDLLIQR
jgi:hypothetical protein